jgi:hypothetical protein
MSAAFWTLYGQGGCTSTFALFLPAPFPFADPNMMQFDYCSDLHLDYDGASSRVLNHFPKKRSSTLILAGDIMELGA